MAQSDEDLDASPGWLAAARSRVSDEFISSVLGSIFGSLLGAFLGALGGVAWAAPDPVERFIKMNEGGYAQPLAGWVNELRRGKTPLEVTFEPQTFGDVYVCESAYVSGPNVRDVFLQYVDRYSMCLSLNEYNRNAFTITPNLRSGQLVQSDSGEWFCKCSK